MLIKLGALGRTVVAVALCGWLTPVPHAMEGARQVKDDEVAALAKAFAAACTQRDRQAVAGMIRFPIIVNVSGSRIPFQTAAELSERFDLIVTPETCRAISGATVQVTPEGATLGNSLVELRRINGVLKVTALAVSAPPAGGAREGAAGRGAGTLPNGDIPLPVRVGPRPTQRSGALHAGATDVYLIRASAQQLVEIRIDGVPGRDVVARLLHAGNDTPVDARADQGGRVWAGRVAAGQYRIQVVRRAPGPDTLTYTLSVTLR